MGTEEQIPRFHSKDDRLLLAFALIKLLLHLLVNATTAYGYFRDELYYMACSEHLDMGYVDQPPFSIYVLAVSRMVFGDSLIGLRFLPALAGAVSVYMTGLLARELGGSRFAQALAAIAALCSPIFLGMNSIYSMNSFDILFWTLSAYLVVLLLKSESPRYWLLLGVVLGLGLLNKIGVLWLGFGITAGFLLTPNRWWFKTRWPWIAAAIAAVLFLPYLIWNLLNDMAHVEFIRNATGGKYSSLTPIRFLSEQFLINNPFAVPVWLTGLWFFFGAKSGKEFRVLGWIYVAASAVLVANVNSKAEYLSPAYTMLFAGGAVAVEQFAAARAWPWLRAVTIGLVSIGGAVLAPFVLTILPVETYARYAETLGMKPSTAENKRLERLPQFYADMFGWEDLAATVLSVYNSLPAEEQSKCLIYAQNYGEAGAISFFGRRYHLPRVTSGHNSYYLWGPGTVMPEVVIIVGGDISDHLQGFESVERVAVHTCNDCMPYENNLPIFVARKLKRPLGEIWPLTKNYS